MLQLKNKKVSGYGGGTPIYNSITQESEAGGLLGFEPSFSHKINKEVTIKLNTAHHALSVWT